MVLVILYLLVLAFFLRSDKVTPGGVARRWDHSAPDASDVVASPPISERSAGVWQWERLGSLGKLAPKTHGGPVSPRAGTPSVALEWTALDDHQLNRLLKESWSQTD